jgi:hypothetical protein
MEWGATLPPLSPPCMDPSLPRDVTPLLTGSMDDEHQWKHPRAKGRPPTSLSRQLLPALVTYDRDGEEDPSVCPGGEEMGLTPHHEVPQALEDPTAMATVSLLGLGELGPPLKKLRTKGCLPPYAQYTYVGCRMPPFFVTYQISYLSSEFDGL